MKKFLFCAVLFASLPVSAANDLAAANALFEQKKYPEALALYTRLANAGNVDAQQQLGQMYWYGEAGAVDEAKAEAWFRKAAAKGNAVAASSLVVMQQRVERRADIDYWVGKYDGAELKSGKYYCPAPRIPAISKQPDEIERVSAAISNWQACYNGFVENMNASSPLVKRIPADVVKLMNASETERAKTYLATVQENLVEEAKVSAKLVLADVAAWRSATEAYVKEHKAIIDAGPSAERQREIDARRSNYSQTGK
ncbi:sel1 repeat family protein [Massilia suwonensis]|uniref:Sel1 repeat family protein n=1 Tax=Massilia suwonensis TaxID=648895 RepID=A0ABW0MMN7_9BURK